MSFDVDYHSKSSQPQKQFRTKGLPKLKHVYSVGVDIVTDPYTNGSTGVVNIYAYQMADVAVAHAGAFQKVTLTA
jgi:hypothetical protein